MEISGSSAITDNKQTDNKALNDNTKLTRTKQYSVQPLHKNICLSILSIIDNAVSPVYDYPKNIEKSKVEAIVKKSQDRMRTATIAAIATLNEGEIFSYDGNMFQVVASKASSGGTPTKMAAKQKKQAKRTKRKAKKAAEKTAEATAATTTEAKNPDSNDMQDPTNREGTGAVEITPPPFTKFGKLLSKDETVVYCIFITAQAETVDTPTTTDASATTTTDSQAVASTTTTETAATTTAPGLTEDDAETKSKMAAGGMTPSVETGTIDYSTAKSNSDSISIETNICPKKKKGRKSKKLSKIRPMSMNSTQLGNGPTDCYNVTFDAEKKPLKSGESEGFGYWKEYNGFSLLDFNGIYATDRPGKYCCNHNTQFTYIKATTVNTGGYSWNRLYDSPITYVLFLFDLYILAAILVGCVMKQKKFDTQATAMRVADESQMGATGKIDVIPSKLDQDSHITYNQTSTIPSVYDSSSGHKNMLVVFLMGLIYKKRCRTPFTTDHPTLQRGARGIINALVLLELWAFIGFVVDMGESLPVWAYYVVSLITSFFLARLFTMSMEIIMRRRNNILIKSLKYVFAFTLIGGLHVLIGYFAIDLGWDEFWHWSIISAVVFVCEMCIWENLSLLVQVGLVKMIQMSEKENRGKSMLRMFVTPPLYRRALGQ